MKEDEIDLLRNDALPEEAIRAVKAEWQRDPDMAAAASVTFIVDRERAVNADQTAIDQARAKLVRRYGEDNVFDHLQLCLAFLPLGFYRGYLAAHRKSDEVLGVMSYTKDGEPAFYYDFRPYDG